MTKPLAQRIRELGDQYPNGSSAAADLYLAADVLNELFNSGQRMSAMPLFTEGTKPHEEIRNLVRRSFSGGVAEC